MEQDIICYYDNDDSNYSDDSKHDDHDRGEFYSFYVMTCLLMLKLLTMKMSQLR